MRFLQSLLDGYFIKKPRFRRFVTSILEPDQNQIIDLCGTQVCINRRREHGYLRASRLVTSSSLLRDELPVLINLAAIIGKTGGTFIDIGANVGIFTHTFCRFRKLFPDLRLVAFEPHPTTFARLSQLADPAIQFFNCAVGDIDGTETFVDGAVSHVFTHQQNENAYSITEARQSVQVKRLDSFDFGDGPFVIKIDVEGQEFNIINGAKKLLSDGRVRAVYIDGFDDPRVVEELRRHGFAFRDGRTLEEAPDGRVFSLLALRDLNS